MRTTLLAALACLAGCMPPAPGEPRATAAGGLPPWRAGCLEIHHIDAGQAVATLIVAPSGRTLLIDAGEASWDASDGARLVGSYLRQVLGRARLDYVLVSHFHLDHVGFPGRGGLWHLVNVQGFAIGKLLHRDLARFRGEAGATADRWRDYLASDEAAALNAEVVRTGEGQIELGGGVLVRVVAVDGNGVLPAGDHGGDPAPPSENDFSVALLVRFGRLDYFSAGDLSGETVISDGYSYHDMETALAPLVRDVDVYRVSHHGSSRSSGPVLLAQMQPRVAVVQVGDGNREGHPHQAMLDRLAAASTASFLTQAGAPGRDLGRGRVAGTVVVRSADGVTYTVSGESFRATDPSRTDGDGDGYFIEADTDDGAAASIPASRGGCDPAYQDCE